MSGLLGTLQVNFDYSDSYVLILLSVPFAYLCLVRYTRYHRTAFHARLQQEEAGPEVFQMTIATAQTIYASLFDLEFPWFFSKRTQLALFRTYTVPTISSLLARTSLLSSSSTAPKRYAETELLFYEWAFREWGSAQWLQAMARLRAVHTDYRRAGKIKEEDMLFTLAALMTQPVYLIEAWEWRPLTDIELCAMGTFYRAVAEALEIDHHRFLRPRKSATDMDGQQFNGLGFFYALAEWQRIYEARAMSYTAENKTLTKTAMDLFFCAVPIVAVKRFLIDVFAVIMDSPLRAAAEILPPSLIAIFLTVVVLRCRQFLLKHFFLPRPYFLRVKHTTLIPDQKQPQNTRSLCAFARADIHGHGDNSGSSSADSSADSKIFKGNDTSQKTGWVLATSYIAQPYFVAPSIWNRWGPSAWWCWSLRLPLPGNSQYFQPKGVNVPDLGPNLGKTATVQRAEEEALKKMGWNKVEAAWESCSKFDIW